MSLLWGAAEDGSGNAALTSKRLPDRVPRRIRNLIAASVVGAVIAFGAGQLIFGPPAGASWADQTNPEDFQVQLTPSPASTEMSIPMGSGTPTPSVSSLQREYALEISELHGLPPDVQPGQQLEVWVAWDPEFSEGPQIQRLLKTVTLTRFVEPVTADGPRVAIISVPLPRVGDLMYGDRFGSLSVTLPSS